MTVSNEEALRRMVMDLHTENARLHAELAQARAATPLLLNPVDLRELALILTEERYRLDKGDDRPVPQPRWGANVRISQAVNAALDAVARQADDTTSKEN